MSYTFMTTNMTFTVPTFLYDIQEDEEMVTSPRSNVPLEKSGMELRDVTLERIQEAGMLDLYELSLLAGIGEDTLLTDTEDIRERLILIKRKMQGCSHKWKHLFRSVREENDTKVDALIDIMKTVEKIFNTIPTDSLSEILRQEGRLHQPNLLEELSIRMRNLKERKGTVVVAGETNGGKSTFLNLLLGEEILPTNFLHCTFVVTKIVYSPGYSIKTLHYDGTRKSEEFATSEEAHVRLTELVTQQEMKERQYGSLIEEITLGLPADILKSGVTLVDTPGIGEDEEMDKVTMSFVKSTHASAFIYIIKSDTAGGVQEDRLLSFLRAIKERYQTDSLSESFDPQAAMFVCHRWDNIEEDQQDKVKKNALDRLAYVWPGFSAEQTYFFSTKKTMKHLPVDPEFVTDSFFHLLKGLKKLFDRASQNAVKCQYIWLKYMLQPASSHLRSMITHCIRSNEELEKYFKSVAIKQEKLMASSKENSRKLQTELDTMTRDLMSKVSHYLNFDHISPRMELNDFDQLVDVCSQEKFLTSRDNRRWLDEMIIRSLLKYADEHVNGLNLIHDMESNILQAIQDHLGLYKSQIKYIKHDMMHGGSLAGTPNSSLKSLEDEAGELGASRSSSESASSSDSSLHCLHEEMSYDPARLARTVKSLLLKRKQGKTTAPQTLNNRPEFQQSLLGKLRDKIIHGVLKAEPRTYIEERIPKLSRYIRENPEIMQSIVSGYAEWIQECVNYATNSIPQFISVNTKLMDEIREHRSIFQKDKDLLGKVMEDLEPIRHHLRGYGMLYMDDINAEMLAFNVERVSSTVVLPQLSVSGRPNDDSGFQGSGSRKRKVRSLWSRLQGANIQVDGMTERVVVKTYIYDMDDKLVLSEIASLRCLDDPNIATFFGMTRIQTGGSTRGNNYFALDHELAKEKVSAFLFKGDLVSARVYAHRKMIDLQQFVPDLILSLLRGLNYIHRERLVHMELNLDTVMVDKTTGVVKLCQMCKPREAIFPADLGLMTRSCVCLSPSVLQGHTYENTDDMYAFGLLLWELLCPTNPPFKEQRMWPLSRFIDECHPNNMLQEHIKNLAVSENVRDVLKGTLLITRGFVCMPIASVESLLSDLSKDPAVIRLGTGRIIREKYFHKSAKTPAIMLNSPSGKEKNVNIDTGARQSAPNSPVPGSPVRPPRRKDRLSHSRRTTSEEEQSTTHLSPASLVGARSYRRQSEPAVNTTKLIQFFGVQEKEKSKKRTSIFSNILRRSQKKTPTTDDLIKQLQEPFDSDTAAHSDTSAPSSRRSSFTLEKIPVVSNNRRASVDVVGPSTRALVKSKPVRDKKALAHKQGNQPRRFSLQDQSLNVYKPIHNVQRSDSFDGPNLNLVEKFPPPLGRTPPRSPQNSPSPVRVSKRLSQSGSMPCLLQSEAGSSTKTLPNQNGNGIIGSQSVSPTRDRPGLARSQHVYSQSLNATDFEEIMADYNRRRMNSIPLDKPSMHLRKSKLCVSTSLTLGNSLQHLSDGSVDHMSHAIGPIIEDNVDAASIHEEQSKRMNSTAAEGRSPRNRVRWETDSVSRSSYRSTECHVNPRLSSESSLSPPIAEQSFRSSRGRNTSSDLSSSSTSWGLDSGVFLDASMREAKRNDLGSQDSMPDLSNLSGSWGANLGTKSSLTPQSDSVTTHLRSKSAPLHIISSSSENVDMNTELNSQLYTPETLLKNIPVTSPSSDIADTREMSPCNGSMNTSNSDSKVSVPPPPPPIDFAELTFGRPSYKDDDSNLDDTFSFDFGS